VRGPAPHAGAARAIGPDLRPCLCAGLGRGGRRGRARELHAAPHAHEPRHAVHHLRAPGRRRQRGRPARVAAGAPHQCPSSSALLSPLLLQRFLGANSTGANLLSQCCESTECDPCGWSRMWRRKLHPIHCALVHTHGSPSRHSDNRPRAQQSRPGRCQPGCQQSRSHAAGRGHNGCSAPRRGRAARASAARRAGPGRCTARSRASRGPITAGQASKL